MDPLKWLHAGKSGVNGERRDALKKALLLEKRFNDQQGVLRTALIGVTTFTPKQYRSTGMVFDFVQQGDVFSMIYQFNHGKELPSAIESVHLHAITENSANGNICFAYEWGWYQVGDTLPATFPNTGFTSDLALATTDQYKVKILPLLNNLQPPANEQASSLLMCKFTAAVPSAGSNWWGGVGQNEIGIMYMDAHFEVDKFGTTTPY